jgi:hypothetical protein
MSNPPDRLRANRVDSDASFTSQNRVVAKPRVGIPEPAFEPQDPDMTAIDVLDLLFPEREDGQWPGGQQQRPMVQPEAAPGPMSVARAMAPAPAIAPDLAPMTGSEPASRDLAHRLFATVGDDVADEPPKAAPSAASLRMIWAAVAVLAALVIAEAIYIAASRQPAATGGPVAAASSVGTVHVQSTPPGATVLLNGQDRGETPATLLLAAGDYQLEVVRGDQRQPLPVTVKAGGEAAYKVVLADAETGAVQVSSDPGGVPVAIDGMRRGITPLTVSGLSPGEHTVTVLGPSGSIQNKLAVTAGVLASVSVTLPAAANAPSSAVGSITVDAPLEMQLLENGKLVGTSRMDRIILPAGRHDIEAVNEALGYRVTQQVSVAADKPTRVRFVIPSVNVSINAIPWADVVIDGTSVGPTPIGNLSIAIGSHEIVFRHPQLGEQRQTVTVTIAGPNRFSASMQR